jgi:hypothetical protein
MKNQESENTNVTRLSKKLLKEVNVSNSETLDVLIEILETTVDPDPSELYLLESLYQLKEKIHLTKSRLNNYIEKSKCKLPENKLDDLYNDTEGIGTSKLFRY